MRCTLELLRSPGSSPSQVLTLSLVWRSRLWTLRSSQIYNSKKSPPSRYVVFMSPRVGSSRCAEHICKRLHREPAPEGMEGAYSVNGRHARLTHPNIYSHRALRDCRSSQSESPTQWKRTRRKFCFISMSSECYPYFVMSLVIPPPPIPCG